MTKRNLKDSLDEAQWDWIKPHALRDCVILVKPELGILEAAEEVANNNVNRVQIWIQQGMVSKPTANQIRDWDQIPDKKFLCLVVAPYVFIQEIQSNGLDLH